MYRGSDLEWKWSIKHLFCQNCSYSQKYGNISFLIKKGKRKQYSLLGKLKVIPFQYSYIYLVLIL